jgi:hypothetical protein
MMTVKAWTARALAYWPISASPASLRWPGPSGWREAGYELFEDVNSYSKAFGELVEHHRHTPSLAPDVAALIEERPISPFSMRRFDEYATMSIPGGSARRAPSWCCAPAPSPPIPIPRSSSTAPGAPARSSARSR